ncbi:MBL fold metallo-hydrolase, partial [Burkholderia sp.]
MSNAPALSVEGFFDPATHTVSYLLLDTESRACALIDSVLDYDPKSGRTHTASADRLIARVAELGATVHWLLETHVHADHLSAAPYLKARVGGQIAIGSHVRRVQRVFGTLFNAGPGFAEDGRQFDRLVDDSDTLALGAL